MASSSTDDGSILPPSDDAAKRACGQFCNWVSPRVYGLLRRLVGHRETALDLMQETFTRVWLAWDKFDPAQKGVPWVLTIAHHVAVDKYRKDKARKPIVELHEEVDIVDSREQSWLNSTIADEMRAEQHFAVTAAIAQLSDADQELVVYFFGGMTYADLSEKTGRSENAIGAALTRLREKMRQLLSAFAA